MSLFSRRSFLMAVLAAPFLTLRSFAATVTVTEKEASAGLVKPTDPMPKALQYVEDAKKAKGRTKPDASCANCLQFKKAVDAAGKPIKVAGKEVGTCNLFNGGKGYVTASGWCMSWFQTA